jgi:hypothetical protein
MITERRTTESVREQEEACGMTADQGAGRRAAQWPTGSAWRYEDLRGTDTAEPALGQDGKRIAPAAV